MYKITKTESQDDSSFPADGHNSIITKANEMSRANTKRANNDNDNKPQQMHRLGTILADYQWPGPVALSDARPLGIQTVASSILLFGKTLLRGD